MLIDLDRPPPPVATRAERPRPRFAAPIVAALLLALIGAESAPARLGDLAQVASTGGRAVITGLLTPDAIVSVHRTNEFGTVEIQSQPLGPGGPRWTVTAAADEPGLMMAGDTLIVVPGSMSDVTFVDARTGRIRWHMPWNGLVQPVGSRVAVWEPSPAGDMIGELRLMDAATGRTVWSRPAFGGLGEIDEAGGRIVSIGLDGWASVYALADGRPLVEGVRLTDDLVDTSVAVVGGRVLMFGATSVTAYAADDLHRLWRARVGESVGVQGCGDEICIQLPTLGLMALDPATGRVLWHGERYNDITSSGILTTADGGSARVDPATGRVLREWASSRPVGDLLLTSAGNRTWVRDADGRPLGTMPPVTARTCQRAGDYLACQTPAMTATVWKVKS